MAGGDDGVRRLRRSHDRVIGGVAGGIADYFAVDPTIVRLAFVLLFFLGAGVSWALVYLVLWVLMPEAPEGGVASGAGSERGADAGLVLGVLLLGLGLLFLANQVALVRFAGFGAARAAWPLLLIAAGAMLFLASRDRQQR